MSDLQQLADAIVSADAATAKEFTQKLLDSGTPATEILDVGLIQPMDEVGERFAKGAMFVPQMLRSAKTMQECLVLIKPHFLEGDVSSKGRVVIGTVKGDLHDIGKNLVGMMLEGAGFEVIDLGVDVSSDTFVNEVQNNKADVLAMSALLSTTMVAMGETVGAMEKAGLREQTKIIIGGAPVTANYAEEINSDAYAPDAGSCVAEVKKLLG